ncbi:Short-chain dehydrogenase of various substrate specificities [Thermoplasmatales archaeon BRNA1]|nr:Short-chain dehydrogenase of various substrate specificities [Thermoplasmatales archaeon BRNA1]
MSREALITGASSGIGKSIARLLAKEGWNLVLVGRNHQVLDALRSEFNVLNEVKIKIIDADLAEDGAAEQVFREAEEFGISIDLLVNCAGFGDLGLFAECDPKKQAEMIHVNDISLTLLTRYFLPGMIERRSGKILNVASVASFQPGPLMSVYYASKAFVLSFTEALDVELRGTGVTVSALCPGPTNTRFAETANATGKNVFKQSSSADPDAIAAYGIRKAMRGKVIIVCGTPFKLAIFFERFMPRSSIRKMIYKIQKKSVPDGKN